MCRDSRFAWNWGLAQRLKRYKENEGDERYTDAMKQHKELNVLKKTEFAWMYQVSKCIPQEVLRDLQMAFKNYFEDIKKSRAMGRKRTVGFPKFKKKGTCPRWVLVSRTTVVTGQPQALLEYVDGYWNKCPYLEQKTFMKRTVTKYIAQIDVVQPF
ncbi:MAG: helix-turn-helix domain-containing protein [Candidatus Hermodarchaeota archaeon]